MKNLKNEYEPMCSKIDALVVERQLIHKILEKISMNDSWCGSIRILKNDEVEIYIDSDETEDSVDSQFYMISTNLRLNNKLNVKNSLELLDTLEFMVSHKVRQCVSTSTGLLNIIEGNYFDQSEYQNLLSLLRTSLQKLDNYCCEMNSLIAHQR